MSEITRLIDLLKRAHDGDAWHGPSVMAALDGVDAAAARRRPVDSAHTIWELTQHIIAWRGEVTRRLGGKTPSLPEEGDWPAVPSDDREWPATIAALAASHNAVVAAVERLTIEDLERLVGQDREAGLGSGVTVAVMLHGLVAHDIYHAGQISLLRRAT